MSRYINNGVFNSTKIASLIILIVGIIGFIFWGFFFFAILLYGEELEPIAALTTAILTLLHGAIILYGISKKKMDDMVYMYARFFEGDLDGYIFISDMVKIFGKDENTIYNELTTFIRRQVLVNVVIRDYNGRKQIVLQSIAERCKCNNCGAIFNKRMDFAGACPYCQSSDVNAIVIEDIK